MWPFNPQALLAAFPLLAALSATPAFPARCLDPYSFFHPAIPSGSGHETGMQRLRRTDRLVWAEIQCERPAVAYYNGRCETTDGAHLVDEADVIRLACVVANMPVGAAENARAMALAAYRRAKRLDPSALPPDFMDTYGVSTAR